MRVNLDKSKMLCSKTVPHSVQQEFSNILGIQRSSNLGKFHDKINARLASWKSRMLNREQGGFL